MLIQVTLTIGGRITVWLVSSLTKFGFEKEWKYFVISMKWSSWDQTCLTGDQPYRQWYFPQLWVFSGSFYNLFSLKYVSISYKRERERTSFLIRNCFSPFLSSSQSEASIEIRIFGAWMKQIFQNRQKGLKGHKGWGGSLAFSICQTRSLFHFSLFFTHNFKEQNWRL